MLGITSRLLVGIGLLVSTAPGFGSGLFPADTPKSQDSKPGMPTVPQASKTYQEALDWLKRRQFELAIQSFRKAAKQDSHCTECFSHAFTSANEIGKYKEAEEIAREWLAIAATDEDRAEIHYRLGIALQKQGINNKKEKCFAESCEEFKAALQLEPKLDLVHYAYGISLAYAHQDDAARDQFSTFLQHDASFPTVHERAQRFRDRVDLARARMTPPFSITSLDGQHVSLDSLTGKVVLIDFWATWCGPCREALPRLKAIAHKFQEQPLVIISISLDKDEKKWKEFVEKNQMTWLQYRDGSFDGAIAHSFGIDAIPATFTIDADGVLEDQHVGDADIEGKLKKLVARASEQIRRSPSQPVLQPAALDAATKEKTPGGLN
jgi:thiol-disulfide isomerase/thioredoxin